MEEHSCTQILTFIQSQDRLPSLKGFQVGMASPALSTNQPIAL